MQLRFPLPDVNIEITGYKKEVEIPLYEDGFYRLNQNEFSMHVDDVGSFYSRDGKYISMVLNPKATPSNIELYLNGSTYGAILHQRKIMPMHGSSFVYNNKGIMLCGESGAGKSSLTASFCHSGSTFLTDDVTPILFPEGLPLILPLSDRLKLWEDSLNQLNLNGPHLDQIHQAYDKYYLPIDSEVSEPYPLNIIFIIEKHGSEEVIFQEFNDIDRFTCLRNEIYRWEYLQGMKESEKLYFDQLINISKNVTIQKVFRPENIEIEKLRSLLADRILTHQVQSKDD